MEGYEGTLRTIAKSFGIEPDMLECYLHEALAPMKKAILVDPRWTKLEQLLTHGGTGVFFCLIEKLKPLAARPRTTSNYVSTLLEGVYASASARGYSAFYYVNHVQLATPEYFRAILSNHPEAGALMLIPQQADTLAEVCREMGRPCFIIDYTSEASWPVHVLNFDSYNPVRELTHHLIELGHRRIAFIAGLLHYRSAVDRFEGYKAALKEAGLPLDEDLIGYGNWEMEAGHDLTVEFLRLKDRPTAIVCSNDLTALGVYNAIHEAGLSIPNDISVTGFDAIPIAGNMNPPLTTVRQSMTVMAATATTLLMDVMEGNLKGESVHLHPLEVILRESIGRAPRRN